MSTEVFLAPYLDEGGLPWWLGLLTPDVLLALLIGLGVLLLIAAVGALVIYIRLRSSPALRRALLVLDARYRPPGPSRDAARLRVRLQSAVLGARRAVEMATDDGNNGCDLAGLLHRAEKLAIPLDRQLQLLQSEPDAALVYRSLKPASMRVAQLELTTRQIRRAAAADLEGLMVGDLDQLKADADRELTARQAGVDELASLSSTPSSAGQSDGRPHHSRGERG